MGGTTARVSYTGCVQPEAGAHDMRVRMACARAQMRAAKFSHRSVARSGRQWVSWAQPARLVTKLLCDKLSGRDARG